MTRQLTARQKEILLYGQSSLAGRGFVSADEETAAWYEHRAALLKECGFARPHAYVKHELCEETPEWIRSAEELFGRGLVNPDVQATAERASVTLAPDQPADLHVEFETAESVRALNLPAPYLEAMCREFGHAQAYMKFRRRQALTRKYARIGAAIREVLRETIIILVKKETKHAN
jgi:hypothetical protein